MVYLMHFRFIIYV